MRALRLLGDRDLRLETMDAPPPPAPGEVQLRLRAVFGEGVPPASSNKSMIGHTLSAAGAIEAVFSLMAIRDGILPPTINHQEADPAITLDVVPNVARDAKVDHVLSNSFGFGGQNVCLVLSGA